MPTRAASLLRWLLPVLLLLWAVAALLSPRAQETLAPAGIRLELLDLDAPATEVAQARAAPAASAHGSQLSLPMRQHGSWVRVTPGTLPATPVLAVETSMFGDVTLVPAQGAPQTRSKADPAPGPAYSTYGLVFGLEPGAGAAPLLLHFSNRYRGLARIKLWDDAGWRQHERSRLVLAAVVYSAMAAFALVAACYWVVLRDPMFGHYTLYELSLLVFATSNAGFIYSWPGLGWWAGFGIHGQWAMVAFGLAFALSFARHFLSLQREMPRAARVFRGAANVFIAGALGLLASPVLLVWGSVLLAALGLAIYLVLFGVAVAAVRGGNRYGSYFVLAWAPMTVAALLRASQGMGLSLPFEPELFYSFASIWQALVLTLGLADQVLASRRERDLAREAAAQASQLEMQNATLKENVRLREEVERMSRHDLKTPLNSIVALPRLVREAGPLTGEQQQLLGIVERAGYRVLNMVNLSLDVLRMEQGTYRFQPGAVDLTALLDKVLADLRPLAAARQVALELQAPADAAALPLVRAEETLCYSILANILKNAIEAAPDGSAVRIRLEPGETVCLHVHNDGAVPASVRERFFQKYATAGKSSGSGFGAYSARLMARIQEGELLMRTGEAEGTTLTLRLQAAARHAAPHEPGQPPAPDALLPPTWPRLKVLVVEDDEYNLLVMRRSLPSPPLALRTATNGREALELQAADPADVVIMDLEMPVMGGFEAVALLRAREKQERCKPALVVALSSHEDQATRSRCLRAGFDLYLTKPASREDLHRLLRGAAAPEGSAWSAEPASPAAAPLPAADDPLLLDPDLRERLPGFLKSRLEALAQMEAALQAGQLEQVRTLAHRLAGSFALHGFRWAAHSCQAIERASQEARCDGLGERIAAVRGHLESADIRFG